MPTVIYVRLMAWYNKPKQRKTFKKGISKELMCADGVCVHGMQMVELAHAR